MTIYNYFGVTYNDIVSYYHGTTLSDYSTGTLDGSGAIVLEMDYAENKILESLPVSVSMSLMDGLKYVSISDGQKIDLVGVEIDTIYSMPEKNAACCCWSNGCPGDVSVLTEEISAFAAIESGVVSISGAETGKMYYANMKFTDNFEIGSLKRLLRDLVACRLGSQLFSRGGEDEWVSVKRACEESSEMLKKISEDEYWFPYEIKKLKFFPGKSPIKSKNMVVTVKTLRS